MRNRTALSAEPEPQLPRGGEVFLDHVGYFAHDLGTAGAQLERLGFQVSPVNVHRHPDPAGVLRPSGTSNRTAMLRRGYIEVLAPTHDTPLADRVKQALGRYVGMQLVALSCADAAATRARLSAAGFRMEPVIELRRQGQTPGRAASRSGAPDFSDLPGGSAPGGPSELGWSVLRPEPGALPEGRVQFVTCHTPDALWAPALTAHPNAADAVAGVLLCVQNRRESAERLGRYTGRAPAHAAGRSVLALDRGSLVLVEPGEASAMLPGFAAPSLPFDAGLAVRSADLAATRAALKRGGIKPLLDRGDAVCVGPADAMGGYLLFHAASLGDPWQAVATPSKAP